MRKFLHAMLIVALFIATLGSGLKAEAATAKSPNVSKIAVVSNATVYSGETAQLTVVYDWTASALYDKTAPLELKVLVADRSVLTAGKLTNLSTELITKNRKTYYETTGTLTIKGVKSGKKNITLSAPFNKKTKKVAVTVKTWATGIQVADTVDLAVNASYSLNAKAVAGDVAASNSGVTYKSGNTAIATVTNAGKVKGVAVGTTTITVASKDGKVSKNVTVNVEKAVVKSITNADKNVKKNTINLVTNGANTYATLLKVTDTDNKVVNDRSVLSFKSSNEKVATVDANGKITAVGNGTAKVTITPALKNKAGKKDLTFTVKVTTKVEGISFTGTDGTMEILANNAKNNIGAKVNANASNQALKYAVSDVKDENGKPVAKNKVKNFITVKSGNVQAKKPCTAKVTVSAGSTKTFDATSAEVNVIAVAPVKSIKFASGKKATLALTANVLNTENEVMLNAFFKTQPFVGDALVIDGPANARDELEFSSSDSDFVDIDDEGVITIKEARTGKVTLTALAGDGSGKKATLTLTVKVDADKINVNLPTDEFDSVTLPVLYVPAGKEVKVESLIKATVNENAAEKKLTYAPSKVKLADGAKKEIVITSRDARSKTICAPVTLKVMAVGVAEASKDYEVAVLDSEGETAGTLQVGDSVKLSAEVTAKDGKTVVAKAIKWEPSDKTIATVDANGNVKAKKAGTVEIFAKYGDVNGKYTIDIGRSNADVKKDIDKAFEAGLKEENRDYLGAKVKFDKKKALFTVDITNPDADPHTQWKDTGLGETIKNNIPASVYAIEIKDETAFYKINRVGLGAVVTVGDVEETFTDVNDGIAYLREIVAADAATLKELNGKEYTLTVCASEKWGEADFDYEPEYHIVFAINDKRFDEIIDKAIDDVIKTATESDVDDDVAEFAYNADKNVLKVEVIDETASLEDLLAKTNALYTEGSAFFNTVAAAGNGNFATSVKVYAKGENIYNHTEEFADSDFTKADIESYIAKVNDNIAGKTLAAFEGKTLSIVKGYKIGTVNYTYAYTVEFVFGEKAYNYTVQSKLKDTFATENSADFENGVTVKADFANNSFVIANSNGAKFTALKTDKATALFDALTGDSRIDNATIVSVAGNVKTLKGDDLKAEYAVLKAITEETLEKSLSEVDGKSAIITVTYKNGTVLVYTVSFDTKVTPTTAPADISENDSAEDAEYDEAPAEDVTLNDPE